MVFDFILLVLFGFFIALAIGLTGVGAGTLVAPTFIILGVDPVKAVGSALVFSTIVKLPAVLFHAIYKNIDFKVLKNMLLGAMPGLLTGSYLLSKLSFSQEFKNLIELVIGFTILFSIFLNLFLLLGNKRMDLSKHTYLIPFVCFFIGLEVSLTSAGAGALGMILLLYFTPLKPVRCVGTDIAFGLACSLVGSGSHMLLGYADLGLSFPMGFGGLFGIWFGTKLAKIINPKPLRLIISTILLFVAINLIQRGLE